MSVKTFRQSNISNSLVGSSFSGTDVLPVAFLNDENADPVIFADLQTMTITSAVSSTPVLRMGQKTPSGLSITDRTTAGTLIFSHIDQSPLHNLGRRAGSKGMSAGDVVRTTTDIPPFDIMLSAQSEVGYRHNEKEKTQMKIISGIRLLNGSESVSVDDMLLEHQYTYWAEYATDWFSVDAIGDVLAEVKFAKTSSVDIFGLGEAKPELSLSVGQLMEIDLIPIVKNDTPYYDKEEARPIIENYDPNVNSQFPSIAYENYADIRSYNTGSN